MKTTHNRLTLNFNRTTLGYTICKNTTIWQTASDFSPFIKVGENIIPFKSAKNISHHPLHNGIGSGFISHYDGFRINGEEI
ncbi:MAG: hypothetical protein ACTTG8_09020, partial [Catonella sp.]